MAASVVAAGEAGFVPASSCAAPAPFSKQQLLDVAATFVKLWFAGIAKGPQAVEQELASILAPDVAIQPDHVKEQHDKQGLSEVLAELERAHLEYHRSEHRPMLYAASPGSQRAYALVEGRYQDVGALPGHPATFRISKVHHILSIQVCVGRISMLWLRRQLTEEDKDELLHEPLACYPAPFPRDSLQLADAAQHEQAAAAMVEAVQTWWHSWATGPSSSSSNNNNHSSSTISSSSNNSSSRSRRSHRAAAATQLLAPDFKMWDAYGLYPAMRAQGRRYLSKEAALRYMQSLAYGHDIQLTVLDTAVAEGSLACFSHWQAVLTPRWHGAPGWQHPAAAGGSGSTSSSVVSASAASLASLASLDASDAAVVAAAAATTQVQQRQAAALREAAHHHQQQQQQGAAAGSPAPAAGQAPPSPSPSSSPAAAATAPPGASSSSSSAAPLVVDGLAIDLFNEQLQLAVIWVFRGPVSPSEMGLFLEHDRRQAAAEAAQAASDQAAIRAARRAQREQQLHELLTWMNNYQQQWAGYVSHVQKQISRQQKLARQQLIRQLQESGSMEETFEEEEEVVVAEVDAPAGTPPPQQQQQQGLLSALGQSLFQQQQEEMSDKDACS